MSPTVPPQRVNFFLSQLLINITILLVIQLGSNLWGKQKAKTEAIQEERKTEKGRKKGIACKNPNRMLEILVGSL